jgi:RNA polymerase sigma-70 factor (ECF subfamily)
MVGPASALLSLSSPSKIRKSSVDVLLSSGDRKNLLTGGLQAAGRAHRYVAQNLVTRLLLDAAPRQRDDRSIMGEAKRQHRKCETTSSETRTLGDLLFVDGAKAPVSETDWVTLLQRIAAGDQLALHAVYEQTHRIVFTLIVRIVNNRETAEEVTIDVFHDVWRRAATYDAAGGSVIGWIMNQARSRAIDRLRFEQRKKRVSAGTAIPLAASRGSDPQDAFDVREQGRLLRDALAVLTPDERQTIHAAFFSEMTYYEVAETLNQPLGTVKTRIRSGLAKLRQALAGTLKGI